ncbi:hypothetical protein DYB37_010962 [Aphanomyces astaci]|uniref:Uncharacterized protein n=1 Tax=Aphanomyces astaci TaxID=112090 RepID=A0A3R6XMX9_APHAT|nr:hypothetical protein DYB35_010705 [Aphanomyces astaci]RHZ32454.1 hypothetical protein DYB37_010962 [Aphanomyces astaci]
MTPCRLRLLALVPIVTGVYLSAISNGAFSIVGMIITMVANIAFPLRAALVKRLQPFMSLHVMFYSTLYYAMLLQLAFTTILFSVWYFGLALHRMNALGMVVACTGALVYAKTLRWERQTSQLLGSLLKETHQIV